MHDLTSCVMPKIGLEEAVRFCIVDYTNTFAFVAEVVKKQQLKDIIATGRYYRLPNKHQNDCRIGRLESYEV